MKLDRIDQALLEALQKDAQISNKELADRVGLAASSCLERVRALRQAGVVRGAHADIDPRALGIEVQALIAVKLERNTDADALKKLIETLSRVTEVVHVLHVTGSADLLAHVVARDVEHLRDIGYQAFAHPSIAHIETMLIFDSERKHTLPFLASV
jgi:DNA-binding Lrp family transcriptional regulator